MLYFHKFQHFYLFYLVFVDIAVFTAYSCILFTCGYIYLGNSLEFLHLTFINSN